MTTALFEDGKLDNLTLLRSPITWQAIDDLAEPVDLQALMQETTEELDRTSEEELDRIEKEMAPKLDSAAVKGVLDAIGHPDLGNHLSSFEESYIPEEYINYTIPWKDHDGIEDPKLDKFVPSTAPERFSYSNQGERACKGKLQRRGKEGKLGCHLIDLDDLSYLDTVNLKRFLSDDAEILGKTHTGLCSKCQRKVRIHSILCLKWYA